jgi:hypothetical protein
MDSGAACALGRPDRPAARRLSGRRFCKGHQRLICR